MALVEKGVVFLMMMALAMAAVQVSYGAVHKVGDSAGWTTIGNIDYKNWAATKNFQLGDTIIFEYNAQFHNVMRVTHAMYKSCNASSPLSTFTTGNDSIKITNHGHHFFLCGVPGHCQAGQKVDINMPRDRKVSASAAPTPSAMASPVPVANVPAPTATPNINNAAPLIALKGAFGMNMMGLAMAVVALAVSSYA